MLWIFSFFLVATVTQASPPDCLEGYWDMGERAAVIGFQCGVGDDSLAPGEGRLFFCQREALLTKGLCTGGHQSIGCRWAEDAWACHEEPSGPARFDATLRRVSATEIRYHAKSHFNEVDLLGTAIPTASE